jgi:hypothetical protein
MTRNRSKLAIALIAAAVALLGSAAPVTAAGQSASAEMQQVLAEFGRGRWQQAATLAVALATRTDAPDPRAWIVVGTAMERLGRNAAAAQAYEAYLTTAPDAGVRSYVQNQMTRCQVAAETSFCPSACLTEEQKQELAAAQDKPAVQMSEHFEVRAPNAALASRLSDLAERALKRVTTVVLQDVPYPHSVIIQVHRTPQEYTASAPAA